MKTENKNEDSNVASIVAVISQPVTAAQLVSETTSAAGEQGTSTVASGNQSIEQAAPTPTAEQQAGSTSSNEQGEGSTSAIAQPITATDLVSEGEIKPQPNNTTPEGKKRGRGRPPLPRDASGNPIREAKTELPESVINSADGSTNSEPLPTTPAAEIKTTNYEELATLVFHTGTGTLAMIFGPEWNPENDQEKTQVCMALANYMRAKQVEDIPPGVLLAITLVAYSAPRLRKPTTASKLKLGWLWIKSKMPKRKKKVAAIAPTPAATSENPFSEKE